MPTDPKTPAVKEQNPIAWLLGFKESDEQKATRAARENRDKRTREAVTTAIKSGLPLLKDHYAEALAKSKEGMPLTARQKRAMAEGK